MKWTLSLKNRKTFQRVLNKGKWYGGDNIILYVMPSKEKNTNLLGIAVGKKAGNSVKRHRVKRLIKEVYRLNEEKIKLGNNFIILWKSRNDVKSANIKDLEEDLLKILKKAEALK